MDKAENQINDSEHRNATRRKTQKSGESISSLWDNFKRSDILIKGVPEGKEKEQEIGNLFEKIMKENFPNLVKEIDVQVQEAHRVSKNMVQMKEQNKTPGKELNKREISNL